MKKQVKQFFAALLCLCMVAAVLPAGIPQASAAGETVTLNFYELSKDTLVGSNALNFLTYPTAATPYATLLFNAGGWYAFDVTISEEGIYLPAMKQQDNNNYNSDYNVYLIPAEGISEVSDIQNLLTQENLILDVDKATAIQEITVSGSNRTVKDGKYKVVIQQKGTDGYHPNGYYYLNLNAFTLTKQVIKTGYVFGGTDKQSTWNGLPTTDRFGEWIKNQNVLYYNNNSTTINYIPYANYGDLIVAGKDAWFAFDITVDYDGTYSSLINTYAENYTDNYSVYLIPAASADTVEKINSAISLNKYKLGDVNGYHSSNAGTVVPYELKEKALTVGKYKLVLVDAGTRKYGSAEHYRMKVTDFTLTYTGEYVEPTADPIEMKFNYETWTEGGSGLTAFKDNTNYTIDEAATTATVKKVNHGNVAFAIAEGNELVIKFDADVAGDYKLVIDSAEHSDYGLNAEVLVNGIPVGEIHNDNNVSDKDDHFYNKGFGKVALKEVGNELTIRGLAPDTIKSGNTETPRAGNVNFYVRGITLTQATEEAVAKCVEISGDNTKVTAKVIMSDGSELTGANIVYGCVSDPAGAITVNATTGVVSADGTGRAVVEAEYVDANGVVYQNQMEIVFTNDDIFGNVYAYIEEDGTVNFLGGLKTISGYTKVGFYIFEGTAGNAWDMNMVADDTKALTTSNVYETITTTDGTYGASYFGEECGHIFFVEKNIAAGTTVIVRPFIEDASSNKIIYGKQYTMTVGQDQ